MIWDNILLFIGIVCIEYISTSISSVQLKYKFGIMYV